MSLGTFVVFAAVVLFASVVQGISGFAFGFIVLSVFPYIFNYSDSLALSNLMTMVLVVYNSFLYRKYCVWKWMPVGVGVFAVADLAGILVLKRFGDHQIWYVMLGILFIFMAFYLLWGQQKVRVKPTQFMLGIFSAITGLLVGAFGVGGPIVAVFYLEATKSKEEYLGTVQMCSLFGLLLDLAFRIANGMITPTLLGYTGLGFVFLITGVLIAKRLVQKIDSLLFRRIICVLLVASGIAMFFH